MFGKRIVRPTLLITDCARSGTRYMSELLRSFGYDARHEHTGGDGSVCWYCCMLFEENVRQNPTVTRCGCQCPGVSIDMYGNAVSNSANLGLRDHYDLIFHQTRSPMDVIASMQTLTEGSYRFIDNRIGIQQYEDPVLQAAFYWAQWNKAAHRMSDLSCRIEDLGQRLPELCELIGVPCSMRGNDDMLPRKLNSRPHRPVSPNYIKERNETLYRDLIETAAGFGYDLCSTAK